MGFSREQERAVGNDRRQDSVSLGQEVAEWLVEQMSQAVVPLTSPLSQRAQH